MAGNEQRWTGKDTLWAKALPVADMRQTGLVPSNYLQEVDDDEPASAAAAPPPPAREETPEPVPAPSASRGGGATATALYDYEAGEDNELSFPEDAVITNIVSVAIPANVEASNELRRPSQTKTGGTVNMVVALGCSLRTTPKSTIDAVAEGAAAANLAVVLLVKAKVLEQDSVHTKSLHRGLHTLLYSSSLDQ